MADHLTPDVSTLADGFRVTAHLFEQLDSIEHEVRGWLTNVPRTAEPLTLAEAVRSALVLAYQAGLTEGRRQGITAGSILPAI